MIVPTIQYPSRSELGVRARRGPATSELTGFHRLPQRARRARLAALAELTHADQRVLLGDGGLCAEQAEHMVENALGVLSLPLGLVVNLRVDGRDRLVPMAIEEASVVAAASHGAKLLRAGGGVRTECTAARMIGQIQLLDVPDPARARDAIAAATPELLALADGCDPCLVRTGGGARTLSVRELPAHAGDPVGDMLVVHLVVDVRDAMGANTVNGMCERLAPRLAELTRGRALLRIVSNLADQRLVRATGRVPIGVLAPGSLLGRGAAGGDGRSIGLRSLAQPGPSPEAMQLARDIEAASVFAERDPYRAATHNKGIMNGIDAVLVAFGQDWRAVEAGAHAFAAHTGSYRALATWRVVGDTLVGGLALPMPVGVVGGVSAAHPAARVARRITGVERASELAAVAAAVGLAQNLAALRALAAEGIQRGHIRVHARNAAYAAGAVATEIDRLAVRLADGGAVTPDAAHELLAQTRREALARDSAAPLAARFAALRSEFFPRMLQLIDDVAGRACGGSSAIVEMCRYHFSTGGKRLRAVLPLALAEVLGADPAMLVPFGAACEMLHNATLVHDDIQDGDRLRRGHPTAWDRFGMPSALNLGDAMFYYTLLAIGQLELSAAARERALGRVLRETLRVIDGQEREIALRKAPNPSVADYVVMVEGKTSGLFALPIAGAAELVGAPAPVVAALEETSRHLGVLFQVQDDLLDLYGDKGRGEIGADIGEGKRSLLVVHALEQADASTRRRLLDILDGDRALTGPNEVREVLDLLDVLGSQRFALDFIAQREQQAALAVEQAGHPALSQFVAGCCELLLAPIAPLREASSGRPC